MGIPEPEPEGFGRANEVKRQARDYIPKTVSDSASRPRGEGEEAIPPSEQDIQDQQLY